jgi:alcohol dehydrogenase (cytochrome c)
MRTRSSLILLTLLLTGSVAVFAQSSGETGRKSFDARCATCHGPDGNGGEHGPGIVMRIADRTDAQVTASIRQGIPNRGMPPFHLAEAEMKELVSYLRTLRPPRGRRFGGAPVRGKFTLVDGSGIEGFVLGQTEWELQLRTDDRKIHLLRKEGDRYRRATTQVDWPTYHGTISGNRYTTMTQITPANVKRLAPKFVYSVPNAGRLQGTPIVYEGIMYVTNINACYALDAGTGKLLWQFLRPRATGCSW